MSKLAGARLVGQAVWSRRGVPWRSSAERRAGILVFENWNVIGGKLASWFPRARSTHAEGALGLGSGSGKLSVGFDQ